jgi:hypothetical protein
MQEQQKIQSAYKERLAKAAEKYEDFHDVAESQDVAISVPMAHAIMASEYGPELQYLLGKERAEAGRLSKLFVPQQVLALGRMEAKLAAQVAPAAPKAPANEAAPTPKPAVSSAPPPVKPAKAGNADAVKDPNDMSMEEYAAFRSKQLQGQRRPGSRVN